MEGEVISRYRFLIALCFALGLAWYVVYLYSQSLESFSTTWYQASTVELTLLAAFVVTLLFAINRSFRMFDKIVERRRPRKSKGENKRSKTSSEIQVESLVMVSLFLAIIALPVLLLLIVPYFGSFHPVLVLALLIFSFLGCHASISFVLALRERWSRPQFELFGKYVLALDVGLPALLVAALSPLFLFLDVTRLTRPLVDVAFLAVASLFFTVIYVSRRAFGKRFEGWFTIKGISGSAARDDPVKLSMEGHRKLRRGNYEGAGEAFDFAGWACVSLEKLKDAGGYFEKAGESYSKDNKVTFGAVCSFAFAAACNILDHDLVRARNDIESGNAILDKEKLDSAGEFAHELLAFLTFVCNRQTEKADAQWKTVEKKLSEWMYPFPEASGIFERCLHPSRLEEGNW